MIYFKVLHFPPTVYNHVVQDLKKDLVLVLNKVCTTLYIITIFFLNIMQKPGFIRDSIELSPLNLCSWTFN